MMQMDGPTDSLMDGDGYGRTDKVTFAYHAIKITKMGIFENENHSLEERNFITN